MKKLLLSIVFLCLGWFASYAQTLNVDLGPDQSVCPDSCLTIGALGSFAADGYIWSTGDTTRNITFCMVGISDTTLVLSAFDSAGAFGIDSIRLTVATCGDSVWPGDADNNGVCDVYDIGRIGQGFGFVGYTRPGATTNWVAQAAQDWATSSVLDFKYADCDGNGEIEYADFQVVQLNYGLTHQKDQLPMPRATGNPVLRVYCELDTVLAGDTITFIIDLADSSLPIVDIYSIAFNAAINTPLLVEDVAISDYSQNFMGTFGQTMYAFDTTIWNNAQLDLGLSRYDHQNITGHGNLAKISYILIDDIAGKQQADSTIIEPLAIFFTNVYAISEDGTVLPVDVIGDTVMVKQIISGIGKPADNLSVGMYPNPAQSLVNFQLPQGAGNATIQFYNTLGQLAKTVDAAQATTATVDVADLPTGYYLVRISTAEGTATKKLLIEK